jgi:hypothetical protein
VSPGAARGPAAAEPAELIALIRMLEAELAGAREEQHALEAGVARVLRPRWWDRRWARFLAGIVLWGVGSTVSFTLLWGVIELEQLWRYRH